LVAVKLRHGHCGESAAVPKFKISDRSKYENHETPMSWYGYVALASLIVCQYLMFRKVEPVYTFFTPIQWWNYIFLLDAILSARKKSSLIFSRSAEFGIMLVLSILCWLVFEGYNRLLENWYYINLSQAKWQRLIGYSTSFASIFPGIFLTAEVLESYGLLKDRERASRHLSSGFLVGSFVGGLACLIFPIVFPSRYVFGLVWLGFFFLLDPINYWSGASSIYRDLENGIWQRFWLLLIGGGICGLLWEFWNYWANAKWIYTVPFTENLKYFEMPLLGFIGFAPFALECFAMYHFIRKLLAK
jgi:hypothetical protein